MSAGASIASLIALPLERATLGRLVLGRSGASPVWWSPSAPPPCSCTPDPHEPFGSPCEHVELSALWAGASPPPPRQALSVATWRQRLQLAPPAPDPEIVASSLDDLDEILSNPRAGLVAMLSSEYLSRPRPAFDRRDHATVARWIADLRAPAPPDPDDRQLRVQRLRLLALATRHPAADPAWRSALTDHLTPVLEVTPRRTPQGRLLLPLPQRLALRLLADGEWDALRASLLALPPHGPLLPWIAAGAPATELARWPRPVLAALLTHPDRSVRLALGRRLGALAAPTR